MKSEPDFLRNLRHEIDWRVWADRAIIAGLALLAGLAVVALTLMVDMASAFFQGMVSISPLFALIWTPLLTAAVVWLIRRFAPGAGGSGPPQVVAALDARTPARARAALVSIKNTVARMLGVTVATLAGLSLGRQGPSVHVAAGILYSARHFLSRRSGITSRELLVAGGAAGLAAAFNTPLGGIVFAIEELSRRLESRASGLMLSAIVLAGLVSVAVFGNLSYFGRVQAPALQWSMLAPGMVLAVACGILGGLLARLVLASMLGAADRFNRYKRGHPIRFAAGCGLVVAFIGVLTGASAVGGGHDYARQLLQAQDSTGIPFLWTLLKLVATWLSIWSGAPGGLFAPALAMGASLGHDVAQLMAPHHATVLIALGMAGFFAAVTQAPITAMIIVMEMVDGHAMVLSLMASAMLASLVSRSVSRPLYWTQAEALVELAQQEQQAATSSGHTKAPPAPMLPPAPPPETRP